MADMPFMVIAQDFLLNEDIKHVSLKAEPIFILNKWTLMLPSKFNLGYFNSVLSELDKF